MLPTPPPTSSPLAKKLLGLLLLAAPALANSAPERVDFGYAFAPPHRITIGRPSASEKTLLDVEPGKLTVAWSYDDLRSVPLAAFKRPPTPWRIVVTPALDGKPFGRSRWTRGERVLPLLDNRYEDGAGSVRLEAIGGIAAALIRVTARNADSRPHKFAIQSEVQRAQVAHNPAWMTDGEPADALVACQNERADRLLLFALGAEVYPVGRKSMTLEWELAPGETRSGWLVRPYAAYQADLPALRTHDWAREFTQAVSEWRDLLGRASRVEIPDEGVRDAFYASLADLFIMREPLLNGYVGGVPGTEGYRSTAPFEPGLAALALDQLGLHREAADGLRVHIEMQEPNGNWTDPGGWAHHMWGASGFKAWPAMEHYRLTGDRSYLEWVYPRMAASSRWQEAQRKTTRIVKDGQRTAAYGLMPRGMGDCGLMNGTDYFGVFYPHNLLAVFADRLSVEAAEALGRTGDLPELRRIYETALADLRASLARGAIEKDGYRWIPGTPGLTSGSRWGALYALFPTGLLPANDPLIVGTMREMERLMSAGGQPINTGWMQDGSWVAITLDNLAEVHLVRGDADKAVAYLYSTLNHGTPLTTWCEERGQEAGTTKTSGDRQHLWTPLAVVRFVRDALVMERGADLHLASGTGRSWLTQGRATGIHEAPTHFGNVSYRIESDVEHGLIHAAIELPARSRPQRVVLHLRHPGRARLRIVRVNGKDWTDFDAQGETVTLPALGSRVRVEAQY
jgi:hypothetical protein